MGAGFRPWPDLQACWDFARASGLPPGECPDALVPEAMAWKMAQDGLDFLLGLYKTLAELMRDLQNEKLAEEICWKQHACRVTFCD